MYPALDPCTDAASIGACRSRAGDLLPPIVVGGSGGSGTRLVVQMLRSLGADMGSDCKPAGDAMPFVPRYDRFNNLYLPGRVDCAAFVGQLLQCVARHRAGMSRQALWGWKNPRSIYLLPLLDRVIPGLRFVHLVRDGLAMSSSANQSQLAEHGDTVMPPSMHDPPASTRSLALWAIFNSAAADHGQTMGARYPCGFAACQAHCGAVQDSRPMGPADALRERQDRVATRHVQASRRTASNGATTGFRLNSNLVGSGCAHNLPIYVSEDLE